MSKNLVTASLIAAALLLWLLSGLFFGHEEAREHPPLAAESMATGPADTPRVRAVILKAEQRARYLVLRGRTESKQVVDVKAEISGTIVSRPVERGVRVAPGDLLCEVAVDDREAAVAQAEAALADARIEYEGSLRLKEKGLQSQTAIARAGARLAAAQADLKRQQLNLERTRITAPFGGVVEQLPMNVGDYATPGAPCATLIALDPMLVSADVTESEVEQLGPGDRVQGQTATGREIQGRVTFIGKQSDPVTRTYPVEITVANADYSLRSGLTVNVRIDLGHVPAHQLSPALFTLDDAGELGVRTIGRANVVEFHPVRIIEDGPGGVWVTGLPDPVRLITVGQEYVSAGQVVEPVYPAPAGAQLAQP